MSQLTLLPPELILHIYKEAPSRERKHLRLLCRYFNDILREEVLSWLRIDIHAPFLLLQCDMAVFEHLIQTTGSRRNLSLVMIKPASGLLVKAPSVPRIDEDTLDRLSRILRPIHELRSLSWTLHYGASRHGIPLLIDWMKQLKGLRELNLYLMDHVPSLGLELHASSISTLSKLQVISTGSKSMFHECTLIDDIASIIADAPKLHEIRATQDNSVDMFANVVHNTSRTSDAAVLFSRCVRRDRPMALTTLVVEGLPIRCITPNTLFCMRSVWHFSYLPADKPFYSTPGYALGIQDVSLMPNIWPTLSSDSRMYHIQTLSTTVLDDALWTYLSKLPMLKRLHLLPQRPRQDREDEAVLEKFRVVALPVLAAQLEELVVTAPSGGSCWCFDNGLGDAVKGHPLPKLKYLGVTFSAAGDCDWDRPLSVMQLYSSKGSPEWKPTLLFEKISEAKEGWYNADCDDASVWTWFIEQVKTMPALTHVTIQPPCQGGGRRVPFPSEQRCLEIAQGILTYKKISEGNLRNYPTIALTPMLFQPQIRDGSVRYRILKLRDNGEEDWTFRRDGRNYAYHC